jgi:hypothetical protein
MSSLLYQVMSLWPRRMMRYNPRHVVVRRRFTQRYPKLFVHWISFQSSRICYIDLFQIFWISYVYIFPFLQLHIVRSCTLYEAAPCLKLHLVALHLVQAAPCRSAPCPRCSLSRCTLSYHPAGEICQDWWGEMSGLVGRDVRTAVERCQG